jgi:hypothetical protein
MSDAWIGFAMIYGALWIGAFVLGAIDVHTCRQGGLTGS